MAQTNGLYEQVLEYARSEIDEATSKVEEMRQSLQLLEARVEAAKSVYEAVAARLNLEDEEASVPLQEAVYTPPIPLQTDPAPPVQPEVSFPTPDPAVAASQPVAAEPTPDFSSQVNSVPEAAPEPIAASLPPEPAPEPVATEPPPTGLPEPVATEPPPAGLPEPMAAPLPPEPAPEPVETPTPTPGNGTSDGFSVDLIRQHLEQGAQRAAEADGQTSAPVERAVPEPAPESVSTPPPASEPAAPAQSGAASPGGFELSEADRALIGEYLRSKQG